MPVPRLVSDRELFRQAMEMAHTIEAGPNTLTPLQVVDRAVQVTLNVEHELRTRMHQQNVKHDAEDARIAREISALARGGDHAVGSGG